ncbi:hypothetical protein AeMF1_001832 [Aphanomyces euteiches]|nr:hypothetical protein AeMF1_012454 [Aphanomyces euteiches]KAH9124606.1 hypothetical protein AeMF1_004673 [Aphanomyces euteiches]KAH9126641.1 hypothetical protein AeMF1_002936 [Aphanomyces euteiches]KAH9127953.1 hypothetical protein AeMF1_001832 [Aphanomyces euteiches]KAH9185258.1 hypothetical protein AeNC1_012762 [Aphanomyces euteiches]
MDACVAPWISIQYCWLDFGKKWEMANTVKRQARCSNNYTTNAAVYLETLLRNVQWTQLQTCWGSSLDIALGSPLRRLANGTSWWKAVMSVKTTEVEELTSGIQNALGFIYPMTLKYSNGTLNLAAQTSMTMYWGFASDLWAVTSPSTSMYGASLIRHDELFAFSKATMESILVENGTLRKRDLKTESAVFDTFRRTIGPFGSVDLKRIPAPPSLMEFSKHFYDIIATVQIQSLDFAQKYTALLPLPQIGNMPRWTTVPFTLGGNLLCDKLSPMETMDGLYVFTGGSISCGSVVGELMSDLVAQ